jgi:hypothetical protein
MNDVVEPADRPKTTLPTRLRRALELVYAVEGVVGAQIWQWTGGVAVGVAVSQGSPLQEVLRRVEAAVAPVKHVEEVWEFGLLDAA